MQLEKYIWYTKVLLVAMKIERVSSDNETK